MSASPDTDSDRFWILGSSSANAANRISDVGELLDWDVSGLVDERAGGVIGYLGATHERAILEMIAAAEECDKRRAALHEHVGSVLIGIADYGDFEDAGGRVRDVLLDVVADTYHDGNRKNALTEIERSY